MLDCDECDLIFIVLSNEEPPLNHNFLSGIFTPGHHLAGITSIACPTDITGKDFIFTCGSNCDVKTRGRQLLIRKGQ